MPGLSLRQKECVLCGDVIQNAGRIDRIYCSASCRTLAWRTRIGRRPQHVRSAGASIPPMADVAQLVAQLEAVLRTARDHMAAPDAQDEIAAGASPSHRNTALRSELESVRAELAKERERYARRETELREDNDALKAELSDYQRWLEAAENANTAQEETIQQIKRQLAQAQVKREPSDENMRRIRELSMQNDALQREVQKLRTAKQDVDQAAQQLRDSDAAQQRRVKQLESEAQSASAKISQLQAMLDQAKARTPKSDPLRLLMERKVKLLHDIAITNDRIDVHVPGRRLPDDSPKTFQAAVDYAVRAARQQFYASGSRFSSAMSWTEAGSLLDPISEEKLRSDEELSIGNLEYALSVARRKLR